MANIIIFQSPLCNLLDAALWSILQLTCKQNYIIMQLHYYVGSAPFHKAGIMLYNLKTKQTIIRRSFHQLETSDATISSLPLSISTIITEDISVSTPDQVPPILSSPTTHLSRQNSPTPQRHILYLIRSRSNHSPLKVILSLLLKLPMTTPTTNFIAHLYALFSLLFHHLHFYVSHQICFRPYLLNPLLPSSPTNFLLSQELFNMATVHTSFSFSNISYVW